MTRSDCSCASFLNSMNLVAMSGESFDEIVSLLDQAMDKLMLRCADCDKCRKPADFACSAPGFFGLPGELLARRLPAEAAAKM